MKKDRIASILSLALLLVCASLTHASAKPIINNIRFESPTATEDRIIFELNGPHLPTGKALPGDNPRVYFDFFDTTPANTIKTRMPANGNFIKQIRYAYHKGEKSKTRVVLDLTANQKMDFRQDFDTETNTLVITLYLAGTEPEVKAEAMPEPEPAVVMPEPEPAIPEPEPETAATEEPASIIPEPKPEVGMPEPEPAMQETEPETGVIDESAQPETTSEDAGKTIQPIEDVSITVVQEPAETAPEPEPAMQEAPAEVTMTEPEPEPVPDAMPEPDIEPVSGALPESEQETAAEPEQEPQEELPQNASIPLSTTAQDSLEAPAEETTIIQPMSEIGMQPTDRIEGEAPILHSIEFDPKSNRGEMISFRLNGFNPPVVFGIEEDIPRIVCFFKNTTAAREVKDMIGTKGRYVRNIKVGKYENPDNVRVVLELVPGSNYDLQQIFFKDDKIFMMIINKAGKQISTQGN